MSGFKERLREHVRAGYVAFFEANPDFVGKELTEAENDLHDAILELKRKGFKWAVIKAYFSVFHAGRAVLFTLGLREKTHFAVGAVLDELVKEGKLEAEYANSFNALKSAREEADYHYAYSRETARQSCEAANAFLVRVKALLPNIAGLKKQ
jgi:uncharacterized protein (UPF0332 family)